MNKDLELDIIEHLDNIEYSLKVIRELIRIEQEK